MCAPQLPRHIERIGKGRQHEFSGFSGERLDYRSRRGSCVPVRNLPRTNSCRPFSRKCVPPNRIKGSPFSLQSEQRNGESAAICGGGRGIRTPGRVITVEISLGRRSYAQRIEQRFLISRQPSVPIGFLCFLSLKYHQRCVRLFFIRLS